MFFEENSIYLIDEIEYALHPGYLEILVDFLLQNMEKHQFFITTHSLDFIKLIVERCYEQQKDEQFQIIRLSTKTDGINREILDKENINEELKELEIDLRGY